MHAAQRRHHLLVPGAEAHGAHGAARGGARRQLRVPALETSGQDDGIGIVSVPLHQQVYVPLTVDK